MKIESSSANNAGFQPKTAPSASAQSARERAIAMLTKGAPEAAAPAERAPVSNPTSVSPEEMSALVSTESVEDRQKHLSEDASAEEAPKEATKEPKEETLSSQYAILARKEKAHRARALELKTREDALRAREASLNAPAQPEAPKGLSIEERIKKDPFSVLNELGITYDDLTARAMNQPSAEEQRISALEAKYEAKLKALEDAQEATKKTFEDRDKQSYTQALSQIRNEAKMLVDNNADFETIKATNSLNDVVELIEETFKADGTLLTVEEAAREVEDHLMEEAMKIIKIKKIQQRLQSSAPKAEAAKPQSQAPKQQTMKTLTNAVGATRALTARERAIMAFKGEKF